MFKKLFNTKGAKSITETLNGDLSVVALVVSLATVENGVYFHTSSMNKKHQQTPS